MPNSSAKSRWIATASSSISTRLTPSPACATRSNPPRPEDTRASHSGIAGRARPGIHAHGPRKRGLSIADRVHGSRARGCTAPRDDGQRTSAQRVVNEIVGEIGRLQLEVEPVAVAGQGARDEDMVLDLLGAQPKHARRPLEFRIEARIEHPLLARQPRQRLLFGDPLDLAAFDDLPVALAGPPRRGERFRIAIRDPDLIDVLALPYIRSPAAEFGAACDKKYRHRFLPHDLCCGEE